MAPANGTQLIKPTATGAWGHTSIVPLWVPIVVFAHVFAAFWLFKTWMLNSPAAQRKTREQRRMLAKLARRATVQLKETFSGNASGGGAAAAAGAGSAGGAAAGPKALIGSSGGGAAGGALAVRPSVGAGDLAAAGANGGASDQVAIRVDSGAEPSPFAGPGARPPARRSSAGAPLDEDDSSDVPEEAADAVFEALESERPTLTHTLSIKVASSTLEWQGMGCSYQTPAGPKEVLADVWGAAQPGEMQALLGPSGAGKSTFMDILALRKSVGNLSGRLLVNGVRATKRFIKQTAYVPQDDNFVPTMTAWEVMSFYADIILPGKWSSQRRKERIREVLAEVGLAHAHRTLVGGTLPGGLMMRGLSGGERKRLAIATGILAAPSVLFLDEPTSGLDSFAALTVMGYLKRMVREQSHVVIASIHQPRSAIWLMFDAVTLLASGRLMYHGPRDGITSWFGSLGYEYDPSLHGVPSDWALDLVAIGFAKPARFYGNTITSKDELLAASAAFKKHYLREHGLEDVDPDADAKAQHGTHGGGAPGAGGGAGAPGAGFGAGAPGSQSAPRAAQSFLSTGGGAAPAGAGDTFASSGWSQYKTLLGRELLSITRNPFDVAGRTLTFAWVGIVMGILYYGLPFTANSARSRLNLVFQILSFYCLMPYISMGLYSSDKKFYLADASSQLYRPFAYYAAKISAITPFQIISALVFGYSVYGMAGLRPGYEAVLKNGLINTLMYLIASQVLHCCAIIAPNQDVAFMLSILWTTIQLLLSAFFVNFPEVLNYWITYLRYISATYYSFEAVAINEFQDTYLSCASGLSPTELAFLLGAFPNTQDTQRNQMRMFFARPDPNCVFDTNQIVKYFEFWRPFWMSAVILIAYLLICHILTFVSMLVAARRERR